MRLFYALFFVGCLLAGIGTAAIARQSSGETYSFSLPPRYYNYKSVYMLGAGRISGYFSESQSQPVTFYIFNQQEFDTYKAGLGAASFIFSEYNTPSGTYQADIESAGTYYLVTISPIDQTTEHVTQNFTVTQTSLPYLGIESLLGVGLILIVAAFRVRTRENRRIIASILKENPNYGPGQGDADDQILAAAKNLCRELGLGYEPLRLSWIAWIKLGRIRVAPSDLPLIGEKGKASGTVFMPAILRGKLELREWTSLVASPLIHGFNTSIKPKRILLRRLWLLILVAIVTANLTILLLGSVFTVNDYSERLFLDSLVPVLLITGGFVITLSARKINMINRRLLLEADGIAARLTGREQMLQTLKKIDAMRLSDIEERNREKLTIWGKRGVMPFPSLAQRIQRLETEKC